MTGAPPSRVPAWAWLGLVGVLLFDIWWRGHTFGPTVKERTGLALWPVVAGETEPLDCDEAAYAYIGKRLNEGAVMYRDLTENKPPAGYWLYALAVRLGGMDELTIRLLPLPMVLATVSLVWWLGLRLSGPGAACVGAFGFAILSTDPYVYGNGANLEHAMNLLAVASLAAMVAAWARPGRAWIAAAGALLGLACLVKQVAVVDAPLYALALGLRGDRSRRGRLIDVVALAAGFLAVWAAAVGVLVAQGAGRAAYEDIVVYASALATQTPTAPNAPHAAIRWLTGNSDPRDGALPWPFGWTDWLTWWGTGAWPLWLASVPALAWLLIGRGPGASGPRRLAAAWTLATWVQVVLPGLYWAHYYLLPTPGAALAVGVLLAEAARGARSGRGVRRVVSGLVTIGLAASVIGTAVIQLRDYLLVPPTQLTVRYKGGAQWVRLRQIGRQIAARGSVWEDPKLYVWGWQSPLYFYSGMESPSRHFFANELLKAEAARPRAGSLAGAWLGEILRDLEDRPPEVIFTGDRPFPGLRALIESRYVRSGLVPEVPVLWVRGDGIRAFEEGG